MTQDEAQKRSKEWLLKGSPKCEHASMTLERSEHGYLTGNHVCSNCGAILDNKPPT